MNAFYSPVRSASTRSRRGAFSLLEVAFALVIFVIGAVALLRIFPSGLNVLEDSGNRRVAAQISQNLVTSYTSGDLASTTPDAIYDVGANSWDQNSNGWFDYPSSPLGLRRQKGTVPTDADDTVSAKTSLLHIRGEHQGVFNGSIYTNNLPDRSSQVYFYREGTVGGVIVDTNSGQLDFRNAHYLVSNRSDLDAMPVKADFRQAYLDDPEGAPISNGVITLARPTTGTATYNIVWPYRRVSTADNVNDITSNTLTNGTVANDYTITQPTVSGDTFVSTVTVSPLPNSAQPTEYVNVGFSTNASSSLNRSTYIIRIEGVSEPATIPTPSPVLPIRAPNQLRANCTYYVSSSWTAGSQGAYDQPMIMSATYGQATTEAVVPPKAANSILAPDPQLLAPLRFRQYLGHSASNGGISPVAVTNTVSAMDVDNLSSTSNLASVSVDYDARDWEYISEDIAQFGTPFPGDTQNSLDLSTPQGQAEQQFMAPGASSVTTPAKRGEVREIRTHLGNLRGTVYIKAFYQQSAAESDITFNSRSTAHDVGTLTADQQRAYTREVNSLMKEGRLFVPATLSGKPLTHARVYYRSQDAWAQQTSVVAAHYLPVMKGATLTEPWREYVQDGKYLYFHASEAGKTVEVLHGTTIADAVVDTIEIRPEVIINNVPASLATFTTTYNNPDTTARDPRNGKTYIARSQNPVTDTVFDVRRPQGTSGIAVRTLWLNNDRYSQEIAQ